MLIKTICLTGFSVFHGAVAIVIGRSQNTGCKSTLTGFLSTRIDGGVFFDETADRQKLRLICGKLLRSKL
jgi:hypothetical protein